MKPSRFFLIVVSLFSTIFTLITCKDNITEQNPNDIVFPDSGVSYGKHVEPLFLRACAFSGCHGADTFDERRFSLDTYQHATSKAGIIVPCFPKEPCDPEASILVRRIEGLDGRPRMPLNRTPLNDNQIKGIKTWIREGAQNN